VWYHLAVMAKRDGGSSWTVLWRGRGRVHDGSLRVQFSI